MPEANVMELTEKDWEMIAQAVDDWVKSPALVASVDSMFDSLVAPHHDRLRVIKETMERGGKEVESRKRLGIILRAKVEMARQAAQSAAIAAASEGPR